MYKQNRYRFPDAIEVEQYHTGKYGAPGQKREAPANATARFCPKCGNTLIAGAKFCNRCGAQMEETNHVSEKHG